jgi:dynein heavy chain 2
MFEEAEAIRKAFNAMKYARGEPFKDEHWSAMFKKLGFPKGLRLDQLTVGHFLDTLDTVAENTAWLKDLSSRYAHTRLVCTIKQASRMISADLRVQRAR